MRDFRWPHGVPGPSVAGVSRADECDGGSRYPRSLPMPFVEIYLRKGKTPEFRKAVSQAVHESMRQVFQIPEDDFFHVVHDMEPGDILQAPTFFGVERSADSVIIRMTFNHRPPAQKAELFEAVADRLVEA